MKSPQARMALRRSNPFVMLAVGVLVGGLLVALTKSPTNSTVATGGGPAVGQSSGQTLSGSGGGSAGGAGAAGTGGSTSGSVSGGAAGGPGSSGAGQVSTGGTVPSGSGAASVSSGGSGAASGGGAAGGATVSTDGCAGLSASGVQGVTAKSIKIGFALPDLGVLAAAVNIGNPQADINAALQGLRKEGRLPVCGRDIVPVYQTFNVLDPSQSRAACDTFTDQDHVFAVVALFAFAASECVTEEKKTFLLDAGQTETLSEMATTPLLFTSDPPIDAQIRDFAYWAAESGRLNGKSIGVYYNQNGPGGTAPPGQYIQQDLIDTLAKLGHPVKDVVVSTTAENSSAPTAADPTDTVAVEKFKADGIQVVFPMEDSANFFQQAQAQNYHAQWLVFSSAMASDATTNTYPNSLDGALGLLWEQVGAAQSGIPPDAQTQLCERWYTEAGNGSPPQRDSAAELTLRESCDPLDLLVRALQAAANNLNYSTLISGMFTIASVPQAYYANQTFRPGKQWGAAQNVVEQWHASCTCWKFAQPFTPLYWNP